MYIFGRGVEAINSSPEILAFQLSDISAPFRIIGGLVAVLTAGGLLVKNSFKQVPEGFVGIRTFNGRALDEEGKPLHELLEPGGHWMIPGLHDVELVNRQHQTTGIETTIDVEHPNGFKQYKLGAVATWGVLSDPNGIRPKVSFDDAYRQFYKIDSFEDLESKVAAVATKYAIKCVLELDADRRTIGNLNEHVDTYVECIDGLAEYGVGILGIEITEFAHAGVIQMGVGANEIPKLTV